MRTGTASALLIALALVSRPLLADDLVTVQGLVAGPDGKAPVAGAVVTAYDDKDHVIGQASTDTGGIYKMSVPKSALHLEAPKKPSSGGGGMSALLGKLTKSAGSLLKAGASGLTGNGLGAPNLLGNSNGAPGLLGSLGGASNPLSNFTNALSGGNALKVITTLALSGIVQKLIAAGVPQAKAEKTAADLKSGKLTKEEAVQQIQGAGVAKDKAEAALGELGVAPIGIVPPPSREDPGAIQLKVTAMGQADGLGIARAYLLTEDHAKKAPAVAMLDPIKLQPAGGEAVSTFSNETMQFVKAQAEPAIVHFGETTQIKVQLGMPAEGPNVIVVARTLKGTFMQLQQTEPGVFQCELKIDRSYQRGEQFVSIVAYISRQDGRDKKIEEEVEKSGLWHSDKPYQFNPIHRAAKNRVDLRLTVLEPNPV